MGDDSNVDVLRGQRVCSRCGGPNPSVIVRAAGQVEAVLCSSCAVSQPHKAVRGLAFGKRPSWRPPRNG
jgi:hypothetical protein